jgi:hypothetical protein
LGRTRLPSPYAPAWRPTLASAVVSGLHLDGRATVRVRTGEGRDNSADVHQDRRACVWNDNADTATLRNNHDRLVDEVT